MASANPITEFLSAVERAAARGVDTAPVALATADRHGRPSVRMVLLRGADEHGFVFHTNYTSRKARELTENPHAAICVHWHAIEEQIRIEGTVVRLDDRESDDVLRHAVHAAARSAPGPRARATRSPRARTLEEEYRASSSASRAGPCRARRSGAASA